MAENFEFVSLSEECIENEALRSAVTENLGTFFDNIINTVADYFEEATVESI